MTVNGMKGYTAARKVSFVRGSSKQVDTGDAVVGSHALTHSAGIFVQMLVNFV